MSLHEQHCSTLHCLRHQAGISHSSPPSLLVVRSCPIAESHSLPGSVQSSSSLELGCKIDDLNYLLEMRSSRLGQWEDC